MTTELENKREPSGDFLSEDEESACRHISRGVEPFNQRALALLSLNAGNTQIIAAGESGLSVSQVHSWMARYQAIGLEIFPQSLLPKTDGSTEPQSDERDSGDV